MKVSNLMTKRPLTARPTDTLGRVAKLLSSKGISGCPVVESGRLVGIVTQSDIVHAIDVYKNVNKKNSFSLVSAVIKSGDLKPGLKKAMQKKVRDHMNPVISINAEDDIYNAARLRNRHKIDRLPVVKGGRLVGMLSKSDIVTALGKLDN